MGLYAIGDLHLGHNVDKPMDIFGDEWVNYVQKIKTNWIETVDENDTVLILGDISWAMNLEDAQVDLDWIHDLPGKKVCIKGNHDYWWQSISKLNSLYEDIFFMQNTYYPYKDYAICGSRGWVCPNDSNFTNHDVKIYNREVNRIENSINRAKQDGFKKIIVIMHYPPTNDKHEQSNFTQLFERNNVQKVIYGHLHSTLSFKAGIKGEHNNITYYLASCDYLDFKLLKVLD